MGNICRSPAGEGVLRQLVAASDLADAVEIDSCGTIGFHTGSPPDERMTHAAAKRGIKLTGGARQIRAADLHHFDLILTMDEENFRNVSALAPDGASASKIHRFCEFCNEHSDTEVPDPYYGGNRGFEHVLDLLQDGCEGVLGQIRQALKK
jgi:protein-tyrosine phosphatase